MLNVDGLAMGNPGPAGIREVIRDSKWQVLFVFSKSIRIADSNLAELMVVVNVLSYVANANFNLFQILFLKVILNRWFFGWIMSLIVLGNITIFSTNFKICTWVWENFLLFMYSEKLITSLTLLLRWEFIELLIW